MITEEEYKEYFEVDNVPSNFSRLEYLSIQTIKSIMINSIPASTCPCYEDFKKAVMEQINFYDLNSDLITNESSSGYSLGSYSENSSEKKETIKSIDRLSPIAYEILLNCGLLQISLGGCCYV